MTTQREFDWFALTAQPQDPIEKDAPTLEGADLERWLERFSPLLSYLRRRRVVAVLSGGGMAMPCHVSVLRVLELLDVRIDAVYGTSAGAVVGGLYAAGLSVAELEQVMRDITDPDELFGFAARHPAVRLVAGEIVRALTPPTWERAGIYGSTKLAQYLVGILRKYVGRVPRMSETVVPFSCISFDMGTGRPKASERERATKRVFSSAATPDISLADAVEASMAIPGTLPPKNIGGRFHIDGASVEHLPIATAFHDWRSTPLFSRRRTVALAVDLGYGGSAPREEALSHPMDLILYANSIQSRAITDYNLMHAHRPWRGFSAVLLRPRTISVGIYNVEKIPKAIKTSYEETVRQLSGSGFLDLTHEHIRRASAFRAHG
jgi:predicted acylesterase/phospholipase RssA